MTSSWSRSAAVRVYSWNGRFEFACDSWLQLLLDGVCRRFWNQHGHFPLCCLRVDGEKGKNHNFYNTIDFKIYVLQITYIVSLCRWFDGVCTVPMPSAGRSTFQRVWRTFGQQQNRLCKLDLAVDSIDMFRTLFAGCPSLVSCNLSHAICCENSGRMAIRLNFHLMLTIYFDFPDKIATIYRQMQFQFYYRSAHTAPVDRVIFRSNKPARFWVFAVIFRCCSSVSLNKKKNSINFGWFILKLKAKKVSYLFVSLWSGHVVHCLIDDDVHKIWIDVIIFCTMHWRFKSNRINFN